jgi:hypothetical protein
LGVGGGEGEQDGEERVETHAEKSS